MGDDDFYVLCESFVPNYRNDMVVWWLFGAECSDDGIYSATAASMITVCWHVGNNEDFESGFLGAWNDERVFMRCVDLIDICIMMYNKLGNFEAEMEGLRFKKDRNLYSDLEMRL